MRSKASNRALPVKLLPIDGRPRQLVQRRSASMSCGALAAIEQ